MKLKEFINNFAEQAKSKIIELAQTVLTNENKKLMLDHYIVDYVEKAINGLTVNFVLKLALRKLILPNVSLITQIIFDMLKARIAGVTK